MSRTYRRLATVLSAVLVGMFALLLSSTAAVAAPAAPAAAPVTALPVTGTFTDATGGVGQFVGTLNLTGFTNEGDAVSAVGDLTGTLTDSSGAEVGTVAEPLALPVDQAASLITCDVLNLVLGPLDLNLLGLNVHLNQVVLDITADAFGGLLGSLLCSLAGAFNIPGLGGLLTDLLNQLLALLGSIGA